MTDYDLGVSNAGKSFREVIKLVQLGAWTLIEADVWAEAVESKDMQYLASVKGVDPYQKLSGS